ncbi:MAG: hypothetical protein ACYDA3_04120 [Gaiellaceae bacterium]
MAVLDFRSPGLRRAPSRRAGFVCAALALYTAAALLATWPAIRHADTQFMASGAPSYGEAAPGDHLQTGWNLWLFGEQVESGHPPWLDPYSFQPELSPRINFQGLVFGLPYWPLIALFGAVVAWNLFMLLAIVAAGGLTCAWLRAFDIPRAAALAGGLAFALAPYRIAQSTEHLLGPIALFLPLALWGLELGSMTLAGIAILAVPLSGQVHLALGAVPLFFLYALLRGRWRTAIPGTLAAIGAGLLVRHFAIVDSIHQQGRSLAEVGKYSADWIGFVSRHGSGETFVFLGWAMPSLALVGLGMLLLERRFDLAAILTLAVVVPVVFAVGTRLPIYSLARHVVPELKVSRVPERLLPIACLAVAALLAFAVAYLRPWLAVVALVLVAADARFEVAPFHATAADAGNHAYEALNDAPAGRLLDLPVFLPDVALNSTYLYYDMTARRQRPTGYSTTVPSQADTVARQLRQITCGDWPRKLVRQLGIRFVAVHAGFYDAYFPRCEQFLLGGLRGQGFRPLAADGKVSIWIRR